MGPEVAQYHEGIDPRHHGARISSTYACGDLTLKRCLFASQKDFAGWQARVSLQSHVKHDVRIHLLDEGRDPVMTWEARSAVLAMIQDPCHDLDAVAIETLRLAHEGVRLLHE